jgi:hypothetical protein
MSFVIDKLSLTNRLTVVSQFTGNNSTQLFLILNSMAQAQNTTENSISIVFCVSYIRHDLSLSKYRKQKQSPPGNTKNGIRPGG